MQIVHNIYLKSREYESHKRVLAHSMKFLMDW